MTGKPTQKSDADSGDADSSLKSNSSAHVFVFKVPLFSMHSFPPKD